MMGAELFFLISCLLFNNRQRINFLSHRLSTSFNKLGRMEFAARQTKANGIRGYTNKGEWNSRLDKQSLPAQTNRVLFV